MDRKGRVSIVALIGSLLGPVLGVLVAGTAWGSSPTDELRGAFAEVNRVLSPAVEARPEERLRAVLQIASRLFGAHEAAETALGPQWQARTTPEQQEFTQLFGTLLVRAFMSHVASGTILGDDASVGYVGETVQGNQATVSTTMASRVGGTVALVYRMLRRGEGWVVTDVMMDGVSLVANYQAQFARVLRGSSYGDLVRLMRARTGPGDAAPVPPAAAAGLADSARPAERLAAAAPAAAVAVDASPRTLPASAAPVVPAPSRPAEPVRVAAADILKPPAVTVSIRRPAEDARPVPPPASPKLGAAPAPGRVFWLQVGAFKSVETAQRVAEHLRQQRFPVSQEAGQRLTRVRVGPLTDRGRALATLRELEGKGYRPILTEASN